MLKHMGQPGPIYRMRLRSTFHFQDQMVCFLLLRVVKSLRVLEVLHRSLKHASYFRGNSNGQVIIQL